MKTRAYLCSALALALLGCATPPTADPSTVEASCAQQCSGTLATCSSGFKLFPVVAQKQCNDNYDVCIKGCPARDPSAQLTPIEKLQKLKELRDSGVITQKEYESKRKVLVDSL